ncbi:MAG: hypothetical protein WC972_02500 [Trueperaceae bacterium]
MTPQLPTPNTQPTPHPEIVARLVRIETRLVKLMEACGVNVDGRPLRHKTPPSTGGQP